MMDLRDFTVPENISDVVLIVEGNRLHVEKVYLSVYSTFFRSMFYSGGIETKEKEIPLDDIKYDEFVELLNVIYPSRSAITEDNVEFLLRLGDRFGSDYVIRQCVAFLCSPDSYDVSVAKKLLYVDLYCFHAIDVLCKSLFTTLASLRTVFRCPEEVACLSDRVKAAVLMQLPNLTTR